MFSRKKTLCLLLLTFLLTVLSWAHQADEESHCYHDKEDHSLEQLDVEEDMRLLEDKERILASPSKFRIYPYYGFLSSGTPASYAAYVENELVPPIIDYFQAALKIKYPISGNLKLGSRVSKICERTTPSFLKSTGVAADFFMYYDTQIDNQFVASAKFCYLASGTSRPIVARTMISRNRMLEAKGNVLVHEKNMYVMMHEMMHSLGFSNTLLPKFLDENGRIRKNHYNSIQIAGKSRRVVNIPSLTEKLRKFYGCSTVRGAIMENDGGSGTALSHFERKYFVYETMSSGGIFGRRISEFSLGMLEGTGWYEVDYSYAEPFHYGQGQGCGFISNFCSSTSSKFEEYCTGSGRGCAPHGRGGGKCSGNSILDGCRFYYPDEDYDCDNEDGTDYARLPSLQVFGRGAGSKCFTGTLNTRSSASTTSFCFKYSCSGSGSNTRLNVQIGKNTVTCTKGPRTIKGYYGSINCPDPLTFCNTVGKEYCPRGCMGRGSCVNNKCQCRSGYKGVDCALKA